MPNGYHGLVHLHRMRGTLPLHLPPCQLLRLELSAGRIRQAGSVKGLLGLPASFVCFAYHGGTLDSHGAKCHVPDAILVYGIRLFHSANGHKCESPSIATCNLVLLACGNGRLAIFH